MAFSTAGRGPLKAEMNVTPMIDVLLVLIIVFMVVVASSFQSKGLDAQIPQPATKLESSANPHTIVIELTSTGKDNPPDVKINNESVPWAELEARLSKIFLQRNERVAFLKGDDDVDFLYVAEAISMAKSSGVERVGLLSRTSMQPAQ